MQALEEKLLNASGWHNGKYWVGKHCTAFYLGLPCTSCVPGIHLLPMAASLKREKCFHVACTEKMKPQHHHSLRNQCDTQNKPSVWQYSGDVTFPKHSHTPYKKKTHLPSLNTQSPSCPFQMTHRTGLPAVCWRGRSKENRFQPQKSFLKFILDFPPLDGILLLSVTSLWVILNQLSTLLGSVPFRHI